MENNEKIYDACKAWEEDQKTNPSAVNPHAFVYGYNMALKKKSPPPIQSIDEAAEKEYPMIDSIEPLIKGLRDAFKAGYQAKQQPVRETLNLMQCMERYVDVKPLSHSDGTVWERCYPATAVKEIAELYASSKSVDPQQGWVDVIERLPTEADDTVLVTNKFGDMVVAVWNHVTTTNCTHWMRKPEPPTETNN